MFTVQTKGGSGWFLPCVSFIHTELFIDYYYYTFIHTNSCFCCILMLQPHMTWAWFLQHLWLSAFPGGQVAQTVFIGKVCVPFYYIFSLDIYGKCLQERWWNFVCPRPWKSFKCSADLLQSAALINLKSSRWGSLLFNVPVICRLPDQWGLFSFYRGALSTVFWPIEILFDKRHCQML